MENYKMLVTPEIAASLLEKVPEYQRKESKIIVDFYADEMSRGNWNDTLGGRIILDENGMLMDGQHRLRAVVKSKTTHMFDVVEGVDSKDFAKIDVGKSRLVSDFAKVKSPQKKTAIAGALARFARGRNLKGSLSGMSENKISASDTIAFLNENLELVTDYANASTNLKERCSTERASAYAITRFVLEKAYGETASQFFSMLSSEDCYQDQYAMRTITRLATTEKITREEFVFILFAGFEQYRKKSGSHIRITKELKAKFIALFNEVQTMIIEKE